MALYRRRHGTRTGVDVVARKPYRYPLASASVDLVICGQAFEHMEYFWLGWLEICRIVKRGGLIFLLTPSRGPEHRYPVDCWRFYPDGFKALAKWAGVEILEVSTDWQEDLDPGSAPWATPSACSGDTPNRRWAGCGATCCANPCICFIQEFATT